MVCSRPDSEPLQANKGPDSPVCSSGLRAVKLFCSAGQADSDPSILKICAIEARKSKGNLRHTDSEGLSVFATLPHLTPHKTLSIIYRIIGNSIDHVNHCSPVLSLFINDH